MMIWIRSQDGNLMLAVSELWTNERGEVRGRGFPPAEGDSYWCLGSFATRERARGELTDIEAWMYDGAKGVWQISSA